MKHRTCRSFSRLQCQMYLITHKRYQKGDGHSTQRGKKQKSWQSRYVKHGISSPIDQAYTNQRASEIQQSNNVQGSQRSSIRLTSISGFKSPLNTKSSPKASQGSKNKTVQELIREDVGKRPPSSLRTDRASSPVSAQHASGTIPAGFLKPSGVDGPRASLRNRSSSAEHSAPSKKRDRDDAGDAEGKKRRKKKDKVIGARMID